MGVTVVNTALTASTAVTRARASVVIVAPVAETSAALLAAATSVQIANAVVTAVVPVANLDYIFMASGAYLDTSGRFQYIPDQAFVTDTSFRVVGKTLTDTFGQDDYITSKSVSLAKHEEVSVPDYIIRTLEFIRRFNDSFSFTHRVSFTVSRPLADSFTFAENTARNFTKARTDAFGLSDAPPVLLVAKYRFDTVTVPDTLTRGFTKPLADTFGFTDVKGFTLARPVADSFTFTDTTRLTPTKGLTDSFTQTDAATRDFNKGRTDSFALSDTTTRIAGKTLLDSFNQSDLNTRAVNKALADAFAFTELLTRTLTRTIQDGFAMNDTADLADGITYQTVKYVNNLAFATDAKVLSASLAKTEMVTLTSAGLLTSQSYCDLSYFAEDYVGISRTFS